MDAGQPVSTIQAPIGLATRVAELELNMRTAATALSAAQQALMELVSTLRRFERRVAELERLWVVARDNPELVRELAVTALKGRESVP